MSGMRFFLIGMMAALLGLGEVHAQGYSTSPGSNYPPPLSKDPNTVSTNPPGLGTPGSTNEQDVAPPGPSSWISYIRPPGCCGPTGCDGPIGGEIYMRNGVSVPISGNFFGRLLEPGWQIDGGARSIFYNAPRTSGWVVDLGITNVQNPTSNLTTPVLLHDIRGTQTVLAPSGSVVAGLAVSSPTTQNIVVPNVPIAVKYVNRTFGNLAVGKEWYIWGSADKDAPGCNWRWGMDVGGRYGTEKTEINILAIGNQHLPHLTDTIAGTFVNLHTDIMIPFGPGLIIAGFAAQWGYTWSDILQKQNQSDIMDVNFLGTIGFQF